MSSACERLSDKLRCNEVITEEDLNGVLNEYCFNALKSIYEHAQELHDEALISDDKGLFTKSMNYFNWGNELLRKIYKHEGVFDYFNLFMNNT